MDLRLEALPVKQRDLSRDRHRGPYTRAQSREAARDASTILGGEAGECFVAAACRRTPGREGPTGKASNTYKPARIQGPDTPEVFGGVGRSPSTWRKPTPVLAVAFRLAAAGGVAGRR